MATLADQYNPQAGMAVSSSPNSMQPTPQDAGINNNNVDQGAGVRKKTTPRDKKIAQLQAVHAKMRAKLASLAGSAAGPTSAPAAPAPPMGAPQG